VAEHPELLDINFGVVGPIGGDWIHANAIDYHEQFDQIVFSSRKNSEVYVIDHSTTTEEAAGHSGGLSGHGGDFLYRWGNPQAYGRGTPEDERFFVAHGVNWIDPGLPGKGHLLVFNNGDRPGTADDYSTAEEFVPPVDSEGRYTILPGEPFGPSEPVWIYGGPGGFYGGGSNCGAFRMANGNTLLCHADEGYLFEVTESGEIVWDYDQPVGGIARADRYADSSAGVTVGRSAATALRFSLEGPNPFPSSTGIGLSLEREARVRLEILDVTGRRIRLLHEGPCRAGRLSLTWDGADDSGREVAAGAYFIRVDSPGGSAEGRGVRVTAGR